MKQKLEAKDDILQNLKENVAQLVLHLKKKVEKFSELKTEIISIIPELFTIHGQLSATMQSLIQDTAKITEGTEATSMSIQLKDIEDQAIIISQSDVILAFLHENYLAQCNTIVLNPDLPQELQNTFL